MFRTRLKKVEPPTRAIHQKMNMVICNGETTFNTIPKDDT